MSRIESWGQLRELFEAALELPASERQGFLDGSGCGPQLRHEVLELIAADSAPADRLDQPLIGPLGQLGLRLANSASPAGVAETLFAGGVRQLGVDLGVKGNIGPYRLLCELGSGGMSTVYLAQRNDDHYQQRVAIKVIRQGLDSEPMRRRFRQERQILASLEHPHIARLLDGGSTGDGWPYVVMEYVEGLPIDQHCQRQGLGLRQRLHLFRQVSLAVQAAHRNLVVHRDIKPSNVLVTREGEPKLLDFGIAKLLNPELSAAELVSTRASAPLMTAGYASPEQVRGEPTTTASDVYSLGVLLYELLTGRRPYQLDTLSALEIERVVCQVDPLPPSRLEPAKEGEGEASTPLPATRLSGDLDAIVLQAMAKEPARRYGSAEQLAEDLGRFLEHRPVRARRPTSAYRVGKLIRRNRLASALVLLMVLAVVGLAVQSVFLRRALAEVRAEQERAEIERARGQEVTRLMVDLFEVAAPGEVAGNTVTAREILDRGAQRVEVELLGQPLVKAMLLDTMGQAYRQLGLFQQSEGLLRRALQTRLAELGGDHPEVAESLAHLSLLRHLRSEFSDAERLARKAMAIRQRVFGDDHPQVASSLNDLAEIVSVRGPAEEAEELFNQGLRIRRQQLGPDHLDVAESEAELGFFLLERGAIDEAEPLLLDALRIWRQQLGLEHPLTSLGQHHLADLLAKRGDFAAAIELQQETLSSELRVLGDWHPQVAASTRTLGRIYLDAGDLSAAERQLRRAQTILERGEPRSVTLAGLLSELAKTLLEQGNLQAARDLYVRSFEILRAVLGEDHRWTLGSLSNVARVERKLGNLVASELRLRELLAVLEQDRHEPVDFELARFELGRVLLERGHAAAAEPWLRRGHAGLLAAAEADLAAMAAAELGLCLLALERRPEALPLLLDSRQLLVATGNQIFVATLAKLDRGLEQLGCRGATPARDCR